MDVVSVRRIAALAMILVIPVLHVKMGIRGAGVSSNHLVRSVRGAHGRGINACVAVSAGLRANA